MLEPLFIVAPPRSFTSVVGGMLGQHPQAYGLPEVNLSAGDHLGDNFDLDGRVAPNSGMLRLLAQLHDGAQTDETVLKARSWILKRLHWPTKRVFDYLQEQIGPKMLVEKSPRTTMRAPNLRRNVQLFPKARFLHLTRHPRTTGKSMIDLVGSAEFAAPEKVWFTSQNNIMEFAQMLAPGQYMRIKGEQLLGKPQYYLTQICEWLGVDSSPEAIEAMLHPEKSVYACIGPDTAPFGNDPNFLQNPKLDFERLARIKEPSLYDDLEWAEGEKFTAATVKLARVFGYG
jgi:Sulfotransferase family